MKFECLDFTVILLKVCDKPFNRVTIIVTQSSVSFKL